MLSTIANSPEVLLSMSVLYSKRQAWEDDERMLLEKYLLECDTRYSRQELKV